MQNAAICTGTAWWRHRYITKTLMIVKLTIILLTVAFLNVAAKGVSQTVTFSGKDVSIEQVFKEVESQTGYVFFYDESILKKARPVTIDARNEDLSDFMTELLNDQPLSFIIKNKAIVVSSKIPAAGLSPRLEIESPPIDVRGRVTTPEGEPIAGASVMVKGSNKGTSTNSEGYFALDGVQEDVTLIISASNIETLETKVNGKTSLNIAVKIKFGEEDAVTVSTGYWSTSKRLSTNNISKVTAKEIERQPVTNPLMALQGRVPGLDITPQNGAPGSRLNIQIRGLNSLRSDANYPLYVIDGVPVDSRPIESNSGASYSNGFDPLSTINPSNIASIEILKDAGATAIYGSRGANGVILITTKSPEKNGRTNLDINVYTGWGRLPKEMDLLNTQQYLAMRREALTNDNALSELAGPFAKFSFQELLAWDTTRYTDWQDVLLGETSRISDAQVVFSGGNANTSFRIGGEYYEETTITLGDFGFTRYNGSLSVQHSSSDRRFNAQATTTFGSIKNRHGAESFVISNALTLPPNAPKLYNDDGSLNWEILPFGTSYFPTWTNPLSRLRRVHDAISQNLVANGKLAYEIINGITLKTNLGYTQLKNDETIKNPIASSSPFSSNPTASATFGYHNRSSWIVEPQATFVKNFADHSINVVMGATWQAQRSSYLTLMGSGYTSDVFLNSVLGAPIQEIKTDYYDEYRYMAFFAHIGYVWKNKYLLDLVGRRDGSSRFGPGKRFGSFGAASAAWIFSREAFIRSNIPWVSFGKIRSSYGTTGNDQIGDYQFLDTYGYASSTYQNTVSLVPFALSNPDLAWEVTRKFEFAVEMRFLRDRISLEASRYINRSSNQLISYPLPATAGFTEYPSNFKDATIENSGWEFVLTGMPINKRDLSWNIAINLSIPRNKLVEYDEIEQSPYATIYKVGEPLTIERQFVWNGVNPQTGLHEIKDLDGNGVINSDDRIFTKWYGRKYYGGISNTFSYKNFDLSFLFQFSDFTGEGLGSTFPDNMPGLSINQPVYVLNRWRKDGDVTNIGMFSQSNSNRNFYLTTVRESDLQNYTLRFIRLKTLSVSYQLPRKIVSKVNVQDCRIYLQGQNLFVTNDVPGFDPETGVSLPPLRMITAGIQMKF